MAKIVFFWGIWNRNAKKRSPIAKITSNLNVL
jgi:hypothetical protein